MAIAQEFGYQKDHPTKMDQKFWFFHQLPVSSLVRSCPIVLGAWPWTASAPTPLLGVGSLSNGSSGASFSTLNSGTSVVWSTSETATSDFASICHPFCNMSQLSQPWPPPQKKGLATLNKNDICPCTAHVEPHLRRLTVDGKSESSSSL